MKRFITAALILTMCSALLSSCGIFYTNVADNTVTGENGAVRETEDPVSTDEPKKDNGAQDTEQTAAREPEVKKLSFVCAGDNVIHPGIYLDAAERARAEGSGQEYDFVPMYSEVADFVADADVSFINQEVLMGGAELGYSGYPQFNCPQQLGYDLCTVGFDVVSIANNHMCDKGTEGLSGTISFWKSLSDKILMVGGYENETDYDTVRYLERDGIKIAFLAYTYGSNGMTLYNTDMVVPYLDEEDILRQTTAAKEAADVVMVSVHWGDDSVQAVTEKQKYYGQLFADCGVDVIIGHHPHLIQPITWIEGQTGNKTLCIYSLGNLLSEMAEAHNMVGGFLCFDLCDTDGVFSIENVRFEPTIFYFDYRCHDTKLYFMKDFTEEMAEKHGVIRYFHNTMDLDELIAYTKEIMGQEYLPAWMFE